MILLNIFIILPEIVMILSEIEIVQPEIVNIPTELVFILPEISLKLISLPYWHDANLIK